jgi:uncharacterized MAPEG superfamily protein
MVHALHVALAYAVLTWLLVVLASLAKAHGWTPPGMKYAFGNRDTPPPGTSPVIGRLARAANNSLENLVFFTAVVLLAYALKAPDERVALGADVFIWARIAYVLVYAAGIPVLRTALWAVGVFGMGIIVAASL